MRWSEITEAAMRGGQPLTEVPSWFLAGKPVKVDEASPDAEFILEPHEFNYEWRLCTVPIAALGLGSNWHVAGESEEKETERYAQIEQWMKDAGGAEMALRASPLLVTLNRRRVYLADGFHRAMLAVHKFGLTELPAVVGKPRGRSKATEAAMLGEASENNLPSFEQVVTPEMRAAFTQSFNRSHHGPEAFMSADSLETYISDRMSDDVSVDALADHPQFEHWLQARYREVIQKLMPLFRRRQILAHRIIKVGRRWFAQPRTDLGIYWTYDFEQWDAEIGGYAIWGGKQGTEVIIEAMVPHSSVDWVRTVRAHMDYYSGDREYELRVKKGAPVQVRSIKTLEGGKGLPVPKVQFTA